MPVMFGGCLWLAWRDTSYRSSPTVHGSADHHATGPIQRIPTWELLEILLEIHDPTILGVRELPSHGIFRLDAWICREREKQFTKQCYGCLEGYSLPRDWIRPYNLQSNFWLVNTGFYTPSSEIQILHRDSFLQTHVLGRSQWIPCY